ncbi:hypothetical protein CCMA1212_000112 [Trichoderma ghanense]|uniref:Uncharacterized protein n=1 Tax=Trichoderma ghanense TaxID=65468 RepID=A0ABY2HI06_9HYPO
MGRHESSFDYADPGEVLRDSTSKHNTVAKRQVVSDAIPANAPAMTDANGNVIPFVAKDVYVHPVESKAK